jgi:hypothetical protein
MSATRFNQGFDLRQTLVRADIDPLPVQPFAGHCPFAMAERSNGASLNAPAAQPSNNCGCSTAIPL